MSGLRCSRAAVLRTRHLDVYSGNTTPANAGDPAECVLAVRDWQAGRIVRQVRFKAGPEITQFGGFAVDAMSADGLRALAHVVNAPQVGGEFGPGGQQMAPPPKTHHYLVALDRADRPVIKTFDADTTPRFSADGRWVLEEVWEDGRRPAVMPGFGGYRSYPLVRCRVCAADTGEPVGLLPADADGWKGLSADAKVWLPGDERVVVRCTPHGEKDVPTGEAVASLRAYDVRSGRELWRWVCPKPGVGYLGYTTSSRSALSPDGKTVVYQWQGDAGESLVWLVDTETGRTVRELRCPPDARSAPDLSTFRGGQFPSVAFGPNGQLAIRGKHQVLLWNAAGNLHRLRGQELHVSGCLFSPDGKRLFTQDENQHGTRTLRVWDTTNGRELLTIREPTATAKVYCHCEDVPANLRFEGERLLMDSPGVTLVFDGTPVPK